MNLKKYIAELDEIGITRLPGIYSAEFCQSCIPKFERVLQKLRDEGRIFNQHSQYINSPFLYDQSLAGLLYHDVFNDMLTKLIDKDHVLINCNIISRKLRLDLEADNTFNVGGNWHNDGRYVRGKRIQPGMGYLFVTLFNDLTEENAGTHFIPKSHFRTELPERHADYEYEQAIGKAGDVIILDTGLWHRGAASCNDSRWSMFSYYGPWFMKPYYRYYEMMGKEFEKNTTADIRRLLHYNSIPPLNEYERMNTVVYDK